MPEKKPPKSFNILDSRVVDGDTIELDLVIAKTELSGADPTQYYELDQGWDIRTFYHTDAIYQAIRQKARIRKVDTPEIRNKRHAAAGLAVKNCVIKWIATVPLEYCLSYKLDMYRQRFEGDIFNQEGDSLREYLLDEGLAKDAQDGKRQEWSDEDLAITLERAELVLGDFR